MSLSPIINKLGCTKYVKEGTIKIIIINNNFEVENIFLKFGINKVDFEVMS